VFATIISAFIIIIVFDQRESYQTSILIISIAVYVYSAFGVYKLMCFADVYEGVFSVLEE